MRRVPPLAWVGVGVVAQSRLASRRRPGLLPGTVATVIAVGSLGLLGWAAATFRRHETTVDPMAPDRAAELVTDGPFRLTRNPMYVAMAGVLVAHAVARRSVLAVLPAVGFVAAMNASQIAAEERAMEAKFGADWRRYAADVPRWLGRRPGQARG